jgi:hypothetical protein
MAANGPLNLFQITAPKPAKPKTSSVLSQATESTASSRDAGRKFARMMNEAAPRDTSARDAANARSAAAKSSPSSPNQPQIEDAQSIVLALNRKITPEEATELLESFDALTTNLGDLANNPQAEQQLKEQLTQIVILNEPKTLGELVSSVDEVSVDALAAGSPEVVTTATVTATLGQTAQNVFHAIRKVLSQSSEEPSTQDSNTDQSQITAINPALLALQAATFQAAPQAGDEKTATSATEETVTVITPLAQSAVASYTTMQRAEVDHVDETDLPEAQDINARIPSLTLAKNDNDRALPEIELPRTAAAAHSVDKKPALPTSDFVRQIETLGVTAQALVDGRSAKKNEPLAIAEVKAPTEVQPVAPNTFTLSTSADTRVNAPAPVAAASDVLGRGVVNHAPVREQVSIAIRQAVGNGSDEITLQLDPVELGRIQIKLHMNREGHTQLAFLVDRPETFDALSRDARILEQSLQDAGLKADTGGMQFNLRQQPQPQQMQSNAGGSDHGQSGNGAHGAPEHDTGNVSAKPDIHASTAPVRNYRLDIRDGVDIEA